MFVCASLHFLGINNFHFGINWSKRANRSDFLGICNGFLSSSGAARAGLHRNDLPLPHGVRETSIACPRNRHRLPLHVVLRVRVQSGMWYQRYWLRQHDFEFVDLRIYAFVFAAIP